MAVNGGKNFANGSIISDSAAVVYTVPASLNRVQIGLASVTNYTAGAITIDVWALQSGQTRADNFKLADTLSLAANETKVLAQLDGLSLGQGGTIDAQASAATSVAITLNGTEWTT